MTVFGIPKRTFIDWKQSDNMTKRIHRDSAPGIGRSWRTCQQSAADLTIPMNSDDMIQHVQWIQLIDDNR